MTIFKSHIYHPYEDMSLSFRDLKDIITSVGKGSCECYEKFDGVNVLMTWDLNADELRIARNKSHIKKGGLGKILLKPEFSDRPELLNCLNEAFDVLTQAFQKLDFKTKSNVFGSLGGGIWYSIEILTPVFFNTLKYESKHIIFHNNANSMYDLKGELLEINLENNFKSLIGLIPTLNNNIENSEWMISPPNKIMVRPSDESSIMNHLKSIDNIVLQYQSTPHESLQNFLYKRLMTELGARYPLIYKTIRAFVIKNVLGLPGSVSMKDITSGLDPTIIDQINKMTKEIKSVSEQILSPIEKVLFDFSSQILKDLKSSYIGDHTEELNRIKSEVGRCINVLTSTADPKAQSILQRNMRKLQSVDRINSAMEGIVFRYRNKNYKLTGVFAPINQICGHVKYGIERPKIEKPVKKENSFFTIK